jgi:hypothetical protein
MNLQRLFVLSFLLFLFFPAYGGVEPPGGIAKVRAILDKAAHTGDPARWAKYLIEADAEAEKLARDEAGGCCGLRCVRIGSFTLWYRFNEIEGRENYQHDLLQTIAQVHEGTPYGADALALLLPGGCRTIGSAWVPYFRTVLGILETKKWQDLHDFRLTRIRAEAYETWWSLSKMTAGDALVTDWQLDPVDFLEGADLARKRAIEGYQTLIKTGHSNPDLQERLKKIVAGQDTQMRSWVCYED